MCVSAYQAETSTAGSDGVSPPVVYYMGQDAGAAASSAPAVQTLNLTDYDDLSIAEVCHKVSDLDAPWTDVKAVCDSYHL
jgi:hypothetical protein